MSRPVLALYRIKPHAPPLVGPVNYYLDFNLAAVPPVVHYLTR